MTSAETSNGAGAAFNLKGLLRTANNNIVRLLIAVILIFTVMSLMRPDTFLTIRNMQSMAFQASEIGLLAIAIMVAMLSGGIDLSVVSTANLAGIVAGIVLAAVLPAEASGFGQIWGSIGVAILAGLAVGLLAGLVNGILIAQFELPPILATLGTLLAYKGIGTGITKGTTIFGITESQFIGNGLIGGIVPVPLIILLISALIVSLILSKTRFGLRLYMLGTNPTAARFSGINNRRVLLTSYIISGVLAAIAGIIILGRTNASNVDFGGPYILLSVLLAVLGDVDPYGGSGTVWGVVLALVGVQFLSTGVNMLLFRSSGANFFKEFAYGALLVIVLVINHLSQQRKLRAVKPSTGQVPQEAPES